MELKFSLESTLALREVAARGSRALPQGLGFAVWRLGFRVLVPCEGILGEPINLRCLQEKLESTGACNVSF